MNVSKADKELLNSFVPSLLLTTNKIRVLKNEVEDAYQVISEDRSPKNLENYLNELRKLTTNLEDSLVGITKITKNEK